MIGHRWISCRGTAEPEAQRICAVQRVPQLRGHRPEGPERRFSITWGVPTGGPRGDQGSHQGAGPRGSVGDQWWP